MPHSLLLLPLPQSACADCDAHELLALRLLAERAKGGRSGWAPYIALLPSEPETGASLSAEDVELLHGTYAGGVVGTVRARVGRFVAKARAAGGAAAAALSEDVLRWAMATVVSRAVEVRLPSGGGGSRARAVNASAPYGVPFLAPGADLFNHGPNARVGWALSAEAPAAARQLAARGGGAGNSVAAAAARGAPAPPPAVFSVVALQPYGAGGEVFNNYHDAAGCAHLLAHYGFSAPHNSPHDAVALSFPVVAGGGGGWVGLVEAAAASAVQALVAHARALRESGRLDDTSLAAAVGALPGGGAGGAPPRLSNATLLLRARAGGAPPAALLNLARLVVLAAAGPEAAPEVAAVREALADASLRAVHAAAWGAAAGPLAELLLPPLLGEHGSSGGAGGSGADAPARAEVAVGADGAVVSAGVPAPAAHGAGGAGAPLIDTVALLEGLHLPIDPSTDVAAHQLLLRALARLRGRYFFGAEGGEGIVAAAAAAAAAAQVEADCDSAAGVARSPPPLRRHRRIPHLSISKDASSGGGEGAGGGSSSDGGAGAATATASPAPTSLHSRVKLEAAAAAAAARGAAELPALRRRAAVLACRDAERGILSGTARALSERLMQLLAGERRGDGGGGAQPAPAFSDGSDWGIEDRGAALSVALSYATGHVHAQEPAPAPPPEPALNRSGVAGGVAGEDAAGQLRGNLRAPRVSGGGEVEEGGSHRTERL